MDEGMGCVGSEGMNNGCDQMIMWKLTMKWRERRRNERNRVNVLP